MWCPQAILDVCDRNTWKINDDELSLKTSVVRASNLAHPSGKRVLIFNLFFFARKRYLQLWQKGYFQGMLWAYVHRRVTACSNSTLGQGYCFGTLFLHGCTPNPSRQFNFPN